MRRPSTVLLVLLTAFAAWRVLTVLPGMPPYLATHFAGGGAANGWMSHFTYLWFNAAMWLLMIGSFWSTRFLVGRTPVRLLSLPNKDYWMAQERREATLASLSNRMEFMGLLTLAGILGVHELVYAANRQPVPTLDESTLIAGLIAYFVILVVWMAALLAGFRVPK